MKPNKENHYRYNKNLTAYARDLRKNATKAEACLWKYALKAKQRKGYAFRRQRPIMNYIADFFCKELMLVIEVDGLSHTYEKIAEKDKLRDEAMNKVGLHVLRFDDDMVLERMNSVIDLIDERILEIEKGRLPLNPPLEGETP